jgi:hypothetical protein
VVQAPARNRFFIISLPRSGTAWLANFLTYGSSFCFHEALFCCGSLDDYEHTLSAVYAERVGNADTGAIFVLPALYKRYPDAKYIFVLRQVDDIKKSLESINLTTDGLDLMSDLLWWGPASIEGALVVRFENMFNHITLKKIWDHIGMTDPYTFRRAEMLRMMRVEDGICSGYGRFVVPELLELARVKFDCLMKSVANDQAPLEERRLS